MADKTTYQLIYDWVKDNFDESEADDPSWNIEALAGYLDANNSQKQSAELTDITTYQKAYEYGKSLMFTQQCPNPAAEYNTLCLKALKIQIPTKPICRVLDPESIQWESAYCPNPNCNPRNFDEASEELGFNRSYELSHHDGDFAVHHKDRTMCPHCGQQIDWSEPYYTIIER